MRLHKPNSDVNKAYTYKNAASALLSFSYVKNKAYMTGQTAPGGDFPATGRTLARKRWPWPKRDPSRQRRFGFKYY